MLKVSKQKLFKPPTQLQSLKTGLKSKASGARSFLRNQSLWPISLCWIDVDLTH